MVRFGVSKLRGPSRGRKGTEEASREAGRAVQGFSEQGSE